MNPVHMNQKPALEVDDLESVRNQLSNSLDQLHDADLFLTGGTGFFGRWLVESFLHFNRVCRLGAKLTVLSRDPDRFLASAPHLKSDCIRFVKGDVRDFVFPKGHFTHVIHAATEASAKLDSETPLTMFDVIATGTRRVLDFAVDCGASRLLYVSSGAVYGPQPAEVSHITEEHFYGFAPNDSRVAYLEGKRSAEFLCSVYAGRHALTIPIARCFAFVGPHLPLDTHFAIGNFMNDRLHGRPIHVRGNGTPLRSYLYASDMTAWLWRILLKGQSARAYNVGSDLAISIRELAGVVARPAGLEVIVSDSSQQSSLRNQYVPSLQRTIEELGCTIEVNLDTGIEYTIGWYIRGFSSS
jgi:nucleoside-diphosphate-sugar epimerase